MKVDVLELERRQWLLRRIQLVDRHAARGCHGHYGKIVLVETTISLVEMILIEENSAQSSKETATRTAEHAVHNFLETVQNMT